MKHVSRFALTAALVFFASMASAQVIVGGGRNSPPVITTYSKTAKPNHQHKVYWFPGGVCSVYRTIMSPDMVTVVTTMPEHLNTGTVEMCLTELAKVPFKEYSSRIETAPVNSLKEARTSNMSCAIVGQFQTPMIYQIRFSSFALTGKDKEIRDCMSRAESTSDKVLPSLSGSRKT